MPNADDDAGGSLADWSGATTAGEASRPDALLAGPAGSDEAPAPDGPPSQTIEGAHESLEPRHVHQVVSVRLGASGDSIFVSRTETLIEHSHPYDLDERGDLWDEHARALGMSRPRPMPAISTVEGDERRAGRARVRRAPGRRDGGARTGGEDAGRGEFITFGSKSRLPAHLSRSLLIADLNQERRLALDARDPMAIAYAAERYNTILGLLDEGQDGETIDLFKPVLSVSQAAKVLGYNAKDLRRLLGQGKVSGRKVGSEWRIPLRAVL